MPACLPAAAEGEAPAEPPAEAAGEEGQAQEDAVKPAPPKVDYSKKQLEYVVASPGQVSMIQEFMQRDSRLCNWGLDGF